MALFSTKLLDIPKRITQKAAILMLFCVRHLPSEQLIKVHILLSTTIILTGRAVKPAHNFCWHYKLDGGQLHTPVPLSACLIGKRLCGHLLRFASLGQEKFLLPLLDIDLSSLSVPVCNLVTILTELSRLPSAARTQLI
jgi:hypothetical protein